MKKICVITSSRADFGLLKGVIEELDKSPLLERQLVVTGSHLEKEHGYSYREILQSEIRIDLKIPMHIIDDTPDSLTKSMGHAFFGFADAFQQLKPDVLLVLGDRFEILAPVIAANLSNIPVGHIHGGEVTEGAIDDSFRHALTKLSHVHFAATSRYRERIIQLGESPDKVLVVGGLGVDAIKQQKLLNRKEVEAKLGFNFADKNLMITFHPVTLEPEESLCQLKALLTALSDLDDTCLIFTSPNADVGGRELRKAIDSFVEKNDNAHFRVSLGQLLYLSCMQFVDSVIGNSSSGLLEAPTMGIGTINIGNRQKGRLAASSVIDCLPEISEIRKSIRQVYSSDFQNKLLNIRNPYDEGGSSQLIVKFLESLDLESLIKKSFFDFSISSVNTGTKIEQKP